MWRHLEAASTLTKRDNDQLLAFVPLWAFWHTFPIAEWDVCPHSWSAREWGEYLYQEATEGDKCRPC